jgi:hypothetical protein
MSDRSQLRAMGIPDALIDTAFVNGKPIAAEADEEPKRGRMNKTEEAYSRYLEYGRQSGEIRQWMFEPIKLRLAKKTWYTPDFLVIRSDGSVAFHEVKGFWRDDARVKIKVATEIYPMFRFVAVQRIKDSWEWEYF